MSQAKATCLVMALPAKRREGQRMFGRLHFAWRCAVKITECGRIIRTLPVEKKALAGIRYLAPAGVSAQHRLQRTAASPLAGMRREPAK
jgi:hypothetical protein